MAIWHYKCNLVPKPTKEPQKKLLSEDGFIPSIEEDWEWMSTGARLLTQIKDQYSSTESWSEEILMFGCEKDKIEIAFFENSNEVEYVSVSLDLRSDSWKEFLRKLIPICEKLQIRVYDWNSFDIFDANRENFRESIRNSNAIKFVVDPEGYLSSLSSEK